jgi:hypothetical protein
MPPVHEYRPSLCEACDRAILPKQTWKWTPKGGKVHYHCEVKRNPAGATFVQALSMARIAGAKIGDTSGFEPWLIRAKLDSRGPLVKAKLKAEFWKGVETGEAPAEKSATGKVLFHKGVKVWQDGDGWRVATDRETLFDSLKDAKKFIDAQKNPKVTDRALRYRANSPDRRPEGPKICTFCGSDQNVEVGHLDGHEEHDDPKNLIWNCRSCNTRLGHIFKVLGIGRLTRQYNPEIQGAQSAEQYALAILSLKGQSDAMTVEAAREMIHATPPEDRSYYARRLWRIRYEKYGPSGRYSRNPDGGMAA